MISLWVKRFLVVFIQVSFLTVGAQNEQPEQKKSFAGQHPVLTTTVAVCALVIAGVLTGYYYRLKNKETLFVAKVEKADIVQLPTREQCGDQSDGLSAAYDLLCLMLKDQEQVKQMLQDETGIFWVIKNACERDCPMSMSTARLLLSPLRRTIAGVDTFPPYVDMISADATIIDDQKTSADWTVIGWNEAIRPVVKYRWDAGQSQYFLVRYQKQWSPFKFEKVASGGVRVTTTDSMGSNKTCHPAIEKIYKFLTSSNKRAL